MPSINLHRAKPAAGLLALLVLVLSVAAGLSSCVAPAPRVVVLIGVDTLGADHLGVYGADRPTSPFLDQLAAEGVVFENAFATSPWTLPSFASIFTGKLQSGHGAGIRLDRSEQDWEPQRVGLHRRVILDPAAETLAEALAADGFATIAVAQNPNLDPAFGVDRGFAVYDYVMGSHDDKRSADVVVDQALAWIDQRETEDVFLFVHFFDPHMQYGAPAPYGGMFTDGFGDEFSLPIAVDPRQLNREAAGVPLRRKQFITAAYDEEIRFVDSQIERLVEGLRQRHLWDQALVIFTADHGEELFEHGGFEHGHTLYNEVIRVPLIIWGPDVVAGARTAAVSIADVMPTVLDSLGLPVPNATFGISLSPYLRGAQPSSERLIAAEGTLYGPELKAGILWPYKIIMDPRTDRATLFNLQVDPGETSPLTSEPELLADLRELLRSRLLASSDNVEYRQLELDPELVRRLRALGYIR